RRRDRGWPPKPTKFLALFKRRRPKMWSVPDGHAAGGICSGKRSDRNAAARPSAGGTDAALQIDGRGAETGAGAAKSKVMACCSRRFVAELSIGRIAPPILAAPGQQVEQDCARHDRHACLAHPNPATLFAQPGLRARRGVETESRSAGQDDGIDA